MVYSIGDERVQLVLLIPVPCLDLACAAALNEVRIVDAPSLAVVLPSLQPSGLAPLNATRSRCPLHEVAEGRRGKSAPDRHPAAAGDPLRPPCAGGAHAVQCLQEAPPDAIVALARVDPLPLKVDEVDKRVKPTLAGGNLVKACLDGRRRRAALLPTSFCLLLRHREHVWERTLEAAGDELDLTSLAGREQHA